MLEGICLHKFSVQFYCIFLPSRANGISQKICAILLHFYCFLISAFVYNLVTSISRIYCLSFTLPINEEKYYIEKKILHKFCPPTLVIITYSYPVPHRSKKKMASTRMLLSTFARNCAGLTRAIPRKNFTVRNIAHYLTCSLFFG